MALLALSHKVTPGIREAAEGDWPVLWAILHERPEAHFDETAPTTYAGFAEELRGRLEDGESLWAITVDGRMVGAIGYRPITERAGMLHGVCVSRAMSGRGIADAALTEVLALLTASGVEKVSASYFADNAHIRACLLRLGFEDEGYLRQQTRRNGRLVNLCLMAWFGKRG